MKNEKKIWKRNYLGMLCMQMGSVYMYYLKIDSIGEFKGIKEDIYKKENKGK